MALFSNHYLDVDGIRTHYLEAGAGQTVVLLHSGEFGGAAEISWELTLPALAKHFHVIAPDWLCFGRTDKVFDFAGNQRARVFRHMQRFVELKGIKTADFIGNSMGGSNLAAIACDPAPILPLRSIVLCSGGGFTPLTPERKTLLAYDGSTDAMRALVKAMLHDPKWGDDDAHIAKRQEFALMPGAWESASAPRLRAPAKPAPAADFGRPDTNAYEHIKVPTLIVAGAEDRLREPGYALKLGESIRGAEVHVFERCGHCPNLEMADRFNEIVIAFLKRVHAAR